MKDGILDFNGWEKGLEEAMLSYPAAEQDAENKGLDVKTIPQHSPKSELTSGGGSVESDLISVAKDLESATGIKDFTITSGNDNYHKSSPSSWHNKGMAIDIASPSLNDKNNRLKLEKALIDIMKSGRYDKNGNRLGGINEYDNPSAHSTGGHFHISITPDNPSRDGKECYFGLSGVTSYSQIRNLKSGKAFEPILANTSTESNKKRLCKRKYFTLRYGDANKLIRLKIKDENTFDVYSRGSIFNSKDYIGSIKISSNNIIYQKNDGGTTDITNTELGVNVKQLMDDIKTAGCFNTNNDQTINNKYEKEGDNLTIVGPGDIKSSYTGEESKNIRYIEEAAKEAGITNNNAIIGILGVIGKESGFIPRSENLNYSKERLAETWGVFSKTGKRVSKGEGKRYYNNEATKYDHNPEKLANFIYGQKPYGMRENAFGNTEKGDGWKYRGRGFNQITFKNTYEKYSKLLGIDLVNNPDLLNDPKIAAKAAVLFLINRLKERNINPNDLNSVNDAINTFTKANAGWDNDVTREIAKANNIINKGNFTVNDQFA